MLTPSSSSNVTKFAKQRVSLPDSMMSKFLKQKNKRLLEDVRNGYKVVDYKPSLQRYNSQTSMKCSTKASISGSVQVKYGAGEGPSIHVQSPAPWSDLIHSDRITKSARLSRLSKNLKIRQYFKVNRGV